MAGGQGFDCGLQTTLADMAYGKACRARSLGRGGTDGHDGDGFERGQLRAAVAEDIGAACKDRIERALRCLPWDCRDFEQRKAARIKAEPVCRFPRGGVARFRAQDDERQGDQPAPWKCTRIASGACSSR